MSGGSAASFATVVANQLKQTKSLDNGGTTTATMAAATSPTSVSNRRMSAVDEFVAPTLVVAPRKTSVDQMAIGSSGGAEGIASSADNGSGGTLSYSVSVYFRFMGRRKVLDHVHGNHRGNVGDRGI